MTETEEAVGALVVVGASVEASVDSVLEVAVGASVVARLSVIRHQSGRRSPRGYWRFCRSSLTVAVEDVASARALTTSSTAASIEAP